jgi:hypothetical protein
MSVLVPESNRDVPLYALMAAGGACAGWLVSKNTTSTVIGGALGLAAVYFYERHQAQQQIISEMRQAALQAAEGKS